MKGHGTKFGTKKEAAIVALLSQPNIESAARWIDIAPATLVRWMKEPELMRLIVPRLRFALEQRIRSLAMLPRRLRLKKSKREWRHWSKRRKAERGDEGHRQPP